MKKYLFTLLAVMLCGIFQANADKTAGERAFCNQIKSYLQSEGYAPTIDEDGDVKLKYNGHTFYVSVDAYDDGYYVDCFAIMGTSDSSRRAVLEACVRTTAKWKYLRCYTTSSGNIVYACTGYFANFYQLKAILLDYFDIMNKADQSLKDIYNEYE